MWRKYSSISNLSLALIAILILASCTPAPRPTETSPATAISTEISPSQPATTSAPTETSRPAGKRTAVFTLAQEFDLLNPLYSSLWYSTITHQIWNCWAWDFDDQNNPRPVLVKEIPSTANAGLSTDGLTLTMKLRDDILWSDGTPLTAADFVFTYQMAVDPLNSVAAALFEKVQSVQAPDDRTVVVTFSEPYAAWLSTLWHGLLPAHVLQPVYQEKGTLDGAEWNKAPTVGCGPYVFQEWQAGQYARFTANEKYWLGRPKIDEVTIRFLSDDAAQIAALKNGQADLGTMFSYTQIPELEAAGVKVLTIFSGYNEGLFFYLDPLNGHPALQDVRVRQAIALALDRQAMIRDFLSGIPKPAISYWDNTPYIDPVLQPWPFDPERAKNLLDEAGWVDSNNDNVRDKEGIDLLLTYGTTNKEVRKLTQQYIQGQLTDLGIRLELLNYDDNIFFSSFGMGGPAAAGQLDIFQLAPRSNFPDPSTADFYCSQAPSMDNLNGVNWSGLCDEDLEQLFQAQSTQVDFAARQQTFWQISQMIYEKVYFLGLWQDPDLWGVSPGLTNVRISGITPFFNIIEWDKAP
ncbi:MAG: peptide ABC transporter substrate-binding protein [Anaerolineales bacterium]|nr:peptide ABC transporter substrate-binding protein [Anaerolineales bacterium]